MQTPYVPRSLTYDLTVEKSSKQRSSASLDEENAVGKTNTKIGRVRTSLKNITDQNKMVSFSSPTHTLTMKKEKTVPHRRTKSQLDEENDEDQRKVGIFKKEQTPLTVRKNVKRGRASQGSIVPTSDENQSFGLEHVIDPEQADHVFDFKDFDDLLNLSNDDLELSRDIEDNHGEETEEKLFTNDDNDSSTSILLSTKGNPKRRNSDFSSLLSDDDDDSSSAMDGDLDTTANQFPLTDDGNEEGNTNDSISLSEMIKNFNAGYEDHSQNGRKSIESIGDFEEFLGDTDSSIDLLVTPLVPNKGTKWTSMAVTNEAKPSDKEALKNSSSKIPKDINVKSYSDTEASLVISMQHLEDILINGGEEALDHVLNMARTDHKSPSPVIKPNKDRAFVGLGGMYRRKVDESISDDGFSFHSNVEHGHVIHDACLRSNLKSALIALRSVKAERNDLESNLEIMDSAMKELKLKHDEILVQKDETIERLIKQRESEKIHMEEKMQSLEFIMDEKNHQISFELKEAQQEIEIQREELIRVTKLLNEEKDKCVRLQADVDILRLSNEGMQDKSDEVVSLKAALEKLDQKVNMLEVTVEVKDEEIRAKNAKIASSDALLEESIRMTNNLKLEVDERDSTIEDLRMQLMDFESKMEGLRQDSMETINQLDSQLSRAQEEIQLVPELKDRVAELSNILKEVEHELTEQRQHSMQYERALAETELNLMNVEAEATALKNELVELQKSHQNLESSITNADADQLSSEETNFEVITNECWNPVSTESSLLREEPNESMDLSQLLDRYKARVSTLEAELISKEKDQDELSEALVLAVEEKRQMQEQFEDQCSEIRDYERQIKDLTEDIQRKDRDIERLMDSSTRDNSKDDDMNSLSLLTADIERLRVDLQASESRVAVAKQSLTEKEIELKHLLQRYDESQMKHSEEVEEKESLIARFKTSFENSELELAEKLDEIKSLTLILTEAKTQLSKQASEEKIYIDNLEKSLDSAKSRIEELERENSDHKAVIENFEHINNKSKELEATKTMLEGQVAELQKKVNDLDALHKHEIEAVHRFHSNEIQEKNTVINDLQSERKSTQLQILQQMQLVATSTQTDLEISSAEADAKEAISELVLELQAVTMERESIKTKLAEAENEIEVIKESCNYRELEIIALESSLKKAQALIEDKSSNEGDEMHLVIGELVDEIARIRTSADTFEVEKEEIAADLHYSDETAELEAQRADNAELEVRKVKEFLKTILDNLMESNLQPEARCQLCITRLREWFTRCGNIQRDIFDSFELSENHEEVTSSFMDELKHDQKNENRNIILLDKLFSPNGTEYHDALDEQSPMINGNVLYQTNKTQLVHYDDYQRLRQKCDMLEAEREELISETFALLDSSSATNAAEISALESKLRREAMEQVDECTKRLTNYFVDRMERLTIMRRWQIEGSSPTKSKSD